MNELELIRPYYIAFLKSNKDKNLDQKDVARMCSPNLERDFSNVFRHLEGTRKEEPTFAQLNRVLVCLREHWEISQEGYLEALNPEKLLMLAANAGPVAIHNNYDEAQIGKAVQRAGEEIWLINTYLATKLVTQEASKEDVETLRNWLLVQKKKVKILVLKPDGKGIYLRAKSIVGRDGSDLATNILEQLNKLLDLQTELEPGQLEIKVMDELPGVAGVILSNRVIFGLHLSNGHTETGPWFDIADPSSSAYLKLKGHFDTIWSDPTRSRVLTASDLTQFGKSLNVVRHEMDFLINSKWKVHLHEMLSVHEGKGAAPFADATGAVEIWDLSIDKPAKGIYLTATLKIKGRHMPLRADKLVTDKIAKRNYAHARFTDFDQVSVHLSFDCSQDNTDMLLGYYMISAGIDCCAGYAVFEKLGPDGNAVHDTLPPYLDRILTFRDSSYFSLERTRSEMRRFKELPVAGTYKVYSYGGKKGGEKNIKINWLHIDSRGVARYKNQHFDDLRGRATMIYTNMHVVFTHHDEGERQRRSYLIASVHDSKPREGRFYSAVHLGVSWELHIPTGKRFVLEYQPNAIFEDQTAQTIALHSEAYYTLPVELRKLLSGRVKNLLGFLRREGRIFDLEDIKREWKESIHLSEVFFDSALQNARRKKYEKSADMLLRAINHGHESIEPFVQEVQTFDAPGLVIIQELEDYKIAVETLAIRHLKEDSEIKGVDYDL